MKKENIILAEKILYFENIIQNPISSKEEKQNAEKQIIKLSESILNINDMLEVDEIIFSKIKNNFDLRKNS